MNDVLLGIYNIRAVSLTLVVIVAAAVYYLSRRKCTTPLSQRAWRHASAGMILATLCGLIAAEVVGDLKETHLTQHMTAAVPAYARYIQASGHCFLDIDTPLNHPTLKKLRGMRESWIKTNPQIIDIYTLRRNHDGTIVPILQNEPSISPDGIVPENEYRIAGGGVRADLFHKLDTLFDRGQTVVLPPYDSKYGKAVSVFTPLYDPQGRIEAAVGIDAPADRWLLESITYRVLTLGFFAALMFIQFFFALHSIQVNEDTAEKEKRARDTQHLVALVNCLQDGVISMDFSGIITSWNPAAERIYGYTADEMIGHTSSILMPPDRVNDRLYIAMELKKHKGLTNYETSRIRKDGTRIDVSLSASCITDANGAMVGFCYAVRDVTDIHRISQRMKENAAELERTNKELTEASARAVAATRTKSEFLANMSHEIRTPMTAILGYTDIISSPDSTQQERAEAAQIIRRNGQHLMSLISDILDISRIEAGRINLERTPYSPPRLLSEVISLMRVQAIERNLWLKIVYETPIPDNLNIDPTRIRQIVMNLVGNAIKFTEVGGVNVCVRYTRDPQPAGNHPTPTGELEISIADTGIGIAAEKIPDLFEPFWQADNSTTRRFGGVGLGLSISQRLAQILGGTITVSSQKGTGSIFTLRVHVEETPDARMIVPTEAVTHVEKVFGEPTGTSHKPSNEFAQSFMLKRILLVEDGPDNQRLISHIIRHAGAEVILAANGQIGVDLAWEAKHTGNPFDIILMDMQMPVMDGYAATHELRGRGYEGIIIALTAHAMADDRQKCIQAGCNDYATKPVDRTRLLTLLAAYLDGTATPEKLAS